MIKRMALRALSWWRRSSRPTRVAAVMLASALLALVASLLLLRTEGPTSVTLRFESLVVTLPLQRSFTLEPDLVSRGLATLDFGDPQRSVPASSSGYVPVRQFSISNDCARAELSVDAAANPPQLRLAAADPCKLKGVISLEPENASAAPREAERWASPLDAMLKREAIGFLDLFNVPPRGAKGESVLAQIPRVEGKLAEPLDFRMGNDRCRAGADSVVRLEQAGWHFSHLRFSEGGRVIALVARPSTGKGETCTAPDHCEDLCKFASSDLFLRWVEISVAALAGIMASVATL
jgi:hypothetical protein